MEHEYVHHAPGVKEHAGIHRYMRSSVRRITVGDYVTVVTHRYMRSSFRRITVGDYVTVVTHVRVSWFN